MQAPNRAISTPKVWTRPALQRIGVIGDVAGGSGPNAQNNGGFRTGQS